MLVISVFAVLEPVKNIPPIMHVAYLLFNYSNPTQILLAPEYGHFNDLDTFLNYRCLKRVSIYSASQNTGPHLTRAFPDRVHKHILIL